MCSLPIKMQKFLFVYYYSYIALKTYESSTLQLCFDHKLIGIPMGYRNGVFICQNSYSKDQNGQSTLLDPRQLYTACFETPFLMDFCLKIFRFGIKMFSRPQTFSINSNYDRSLTVSHGFYRVGHCRSQVYMEFFSVLRYILSFLGRLMVKSLKCTSEESSI